MQFACTKCQTLDVMEVAYRSGEFPTSGQLLCTRCQGRPWHGMFPQEKVDVQRDLTANTPTGIGLG